MNPLLSIKGTIISGFVLTAVLTFLHKGAVMPISMADYIRWFHYLSGITWIGLLYYFNFVQVPAMAKATADKEPGPAAIGKYVAPIALLWFRWGAVVTWVTGAAYLHGSGILHAAFTLQGSAAGIGIGSWLGTIMLFNVWVLIWPNQQKILGLGKYKDSPASAEQVASAKKSCIISFENKHIIEYTYVVIYGI
jgi:uncharacterized membrane protein